MNRRGTKSHLALWLFAVAFLAIQTITLAHEIKHDLHQHDDKACVLHLHTKDHGQAAAHIAPFAILAPCEAPAPVTVASVGTAPTLGYHTRAPLLPSVDIVV